jgi:hypothetical protein
VYVRVSTGTQMTENQRLDVERLAAMRKLAVVASSRRRRARRNDDRSSTR